MASPEQGASHNFERPVAFRTHGLVLPAQAKQYERNPWSSHYKERFDSISGTEGLRDLQLAGHWVRFRTYNETEATLVRSVEVLQKATLNQYTSYASCIIEVQDSMYFERHGAQIQIEQGRPVVRHEPLPGSDDVHIWDNTDEEYVGRLIELAEHTLLQTA